MVGKIGVHAVSGVIGVCVRDKGPIYGLYWIDEEITDFAVKAGGGLLQQSSECSGESLEGLVCRV